MPRAAATQERKHDILRDILRSLGLPEKPEYFSKGSTVRTEALRAIRNKIHQIKSIKGEEFLKLSHLT